MSIIDKFLKSELISKKPTDAGSTPVVEPVKYAEFDGPNTNVYTLYDVAHGSNMFYVALTGDQAKALYEGLLEYFGRKWFDVVRAENYDRMKFMIRPEDLGYPVEYVIRDVSNDRDMVKLVISDKQADVIREGLKTYYKGKDWYSVERINM